MRSWKTAKTTGQAVFLYFRAHPETYFAPEHVAAQVMIGLNHVRKIIRALEKLQKLKGIDVQTADSWGRPRRFYCAMRTSEDSLRQFEVFRETLSRAGLDELLAAPIRGPVVVTRRAAK